MSVVCILDAWWSSLVPLESTRRIPPGEDLRRTDADAGSSGQCWCRSVGGQETSPLAKPCRTVNDAERTLRPAATFK